MAGIRTHQRADGTTSYKVYWKEPGQRSQSTRTFDHEEDARTLKDFLDANNNSFALAAQAAADLRSKSPTVADVVAESIDLLSGIEEDTIRKYRQMAARHIAPSPIGKLPVDRLDRRRVIEWFESIDRAAKTKKNIHAVLSAGLRHAVKRGLVAENVAEGIKSPGSAPRTREAVFLTDDQVEMIKAGLDPHYRLLVDFFLGTGLRYSEAAALVPSSFRRTISGRMVVDVRSAWKGRSAFKLGGPKTRLSRRTVTLPKALEAAVQARIDATPAGGYVFGRPDSSPIYNVYFHKEVWQRLLTELNSPAALDTYGKLLGCRPGPHDLRHTHASRLIAAGVPLPVIQKRLGHESIETTVNVYGHLVEDADVLAADALS